MYELKGAPMRQKLLISTVIAAALVSPALAQDVVDVAPMELDAPKISETDIASPEWFSSFTQFSGADEAPIWQPRPERDVSLSWQKGKRWSLSIDLKTRDENSPLHREEMRAGATFSLTPRLSVGGEVSVGANELDESAIWEQQQLETGIRLQSALKF